MPAFEVAAWEFNKAFAHDRMKETARQRELFAPGQSITDSLGRKGLNVGNAKAMNALAAWPPSMQETFRAVIYEVLGRADPPPITVSVRPDYDFEIRVWEPTATVDSKGGVYIEIRMRYPFDPHPSRAYDAAAAARKKRTKKS
jgi:hypothetical protein